MKYWSTLFLFAVMLYLLCVLVERHCHFNGSRRSILKLAFDGSLIVATLVAALLIHAPVLTPLLWALFVWEILSVGCLILALIGKKQQRNEQRKLELD